MSVALESESWMDFLSEFFASRLVLNASRRSFHASSRFHNVSRSRFMLFFIVNERVVSFAKAPWRFSDIFSLFFFYLYFHYNVSSGLRVKCFVKILSKRTWISYLYSFAIYVLALWSMDTWSVERNRNIGIFFGKIHE